MNRIFISHPLAKTKVPCFCFQSVINFNKMRIIALYIMSKNGISEENLNKLVTHAQLEPSDKQALLNLANLGLNVVVEVSQIVASFGWRRFRTIFSRTNTLERFRPSMYYGWSHIRYIFVRVLNILIKIYEVQHAASVLT